MKLIIASIVIFSLVILFLFALFPSDITVSRVIQIKSSPDQIHKKIADLREWYSWNDFLYDAFGANKMASYAMGKIDSNYIHEVYVNIDLIKKNQDSVITLWEHEKKYFTGNFIITGENGQSIVQWSLYFHVKWYPWEKLASMFYDKQLGPLMEKSLLNLRNQLEIVHQ